MSILNTILDLIFPNSCLCCRKQGEHLCRECLGDLPLADNQEEDFIYSVFNYRNKTVKNAVWTIKYGHKHSIGKILAKTMSDKLLEELYQLEMMENFTNPLLIPIPLSKKRLRDRGFNQAEILADELAKINPSLTLERNVLFKIKETQNQARLKNRTERLKNLKGCFEIKNPELVKDRNIILIDDVSTTGATMIEAKKVLQNSGAKKIIGLTFAH